MFGKKASMFDVIKLKLVSCRYPVIERPQIVLSVENALVILDAS